MVSGAVGEGLAVKSWFHRKVASKLPNPSEILDGKVDTLKSKEISAMYPTYGSSLCYELKDASDKKDKKFDEKVNRFPRFMMDNFDTELVVMGIKLCSTQYQLMQLIPTKSCFDEFHEKYGKYVVVLLINQK